MNAFKTKNPTQDIHTQITNQIINALESCSGKVTLPWIKAGASLGHPVNAATGKAYKGINVVALWAAAMAKGYGDGTWATYKQWKKQGAQVRKGEKSSLVVFYKEMEVETENEDTGEIETGKRYYARASWVFNAAQVDGWTPPAVPAADSVAVLDGAEAFVAATGADIRIGGNRACYNPAGDFILMPHREFFTGTDTSSATEGWYATLFHELTHWSGHDSRCARDLTGRFGDASYAMEELVAELGSAFLCADLGVMPSPRQDHAEYIANWLEVLKKDKKAVFTAASKADQAAEWLLAL